MGLWPWAWTSNSFLVMGEFLGNKGGKKNRHLTCLRGIKKPTSSRVSANVAFVVQEVASRRRLFIDGSGEQ